MEVLLILLLLLGLWGLFIWLCSRIGGWIGTTLYDITHNDKARQDKWKTDADEALKKGEKRFRKLN